jgi:hypothetical protein
MQVRGEFPFKAKCGNLLTSNTLGVLTFVRRIGMIAEVIGGAHGEDTLVAADLQHPFEQAATLVVEKIFVPRAFH